MNRIIPVLTVIMFALSNCEKNSENGLEIYLLADYQKKSSGFEIISGSERLTNNPVLAYKEIIMYDSINHEFEIDSAKAQEFNHKSWSVQGTAFALTINKSIIYSGYFMPGYSSLGMDWITIDPLSVNSKIRISLGYPGDNASLAGRDPRNDKRIISLLQKDKKLKN